MAHASQLPCSSVRKKSYDSTYLRPRNPADGAKGRSRKGSCVTLPPIDVVPSPMSLKRTDSSRQMNNIQSRRRSVCDDDTKWLISKLAEMSFGDKDEEMLHEEDQPESMTPEPELFKEFRVFENGVAVLTEEQKMRSNFRPRYCWCYRCQTMFTMYKANDPALENWGNYPCHQW